MHGSMVEGKEKRAAPETEGCCVHPCSPGVCSGALELCHAPLTQGVSLLRCIGPPHPSLLRCIGPLHPSLLRCIGAVPCPPHPASYPAFLSVPLLLPKPSEDLDHLLGDLHPFH